MDTFGDEVYPGLRVGNKISCTELIEEGNPGLDVLHACKTCHSARLAYRGSLSPDHPNYLYLKETQQGISHLWMNLVDGRKELFRVPLFLLAMDWMTERAKLKREILVHCDQGQSRAPALALLWLTKRIGALPNGSYEEAAKEFKEWYPAYDPGEGISSFMKDQWSALDY